MTGKGIISFWSRVIDMISPRACAVCGRRLSIDERQLCCKCNLHMPRTFFARKPLDNEMARMLWGQIPVERAAATDRFLRDFRRAIGMLSFTLSFPFFK